MTRVYLWLAFPPLVALAAVFALLALDPPPGQAAAACLTDPVAGAPAPDCDTPAGRGRELVARR